MIGIESLVFLLMGWLSGRLVSGGFIGSFFSVHDQYMLTWVLTPTGFFVDFLTIVACIGAFVLAARGWTAALRYRYYLTFGIIIVAIVFSFSIIGRLGYGTTFGSHDGVVETEIAADMLLRGINPYATDFVGTVFEKFHAMPAGTPPSPIVQAYPYPPLIPLLTLPFVWFSNLVHLPADGRWMTFGIFLAFCWLLIRFARDTTPKLWLVAGLFFNAFAFALPIAGLNDIVFVFGLAGAGVLSYQRRWVWAAVAIGLAIAAKQTAVVAAPLWLWWVWLEYRAGHLPRITVWKSTIAMFGVTAIVYGPFLIWNASALYHDLVTFVSGRIPSTYPIGGDSFWQFLVVLNIVPGSWSITHHGPWVLAAAAIGLVLSGWWLHRRRTASQWLISVAFVTLVMSIANRFFYENYAAAIFLVLVAALTIDWRERHPDVVEPAQSR